MTKLCRKCDSIKALDQFQKHKAMRDGHTNTCNTCRSSRRRETYDHEKERAKARARYAANPKQFKEWNDSYRNRNPEKVAARAKAYSKKNKEEIQAYQKKYHADKTNRARVNKLRRGNRSDEINKRKERAKTDPLFRHQINTRKTVTLGLRRRGYSNKSNCYRLLGADYETVWEHLKQTWLDRYGRELTDNDIYHIDHIVPFSSATTIIGIDKLHHYLNTQLLTPEDNLIKGSHTLNGCL